MENYLFYAGAEHEGIRLDRFLSDHIDGLSRSFIQKIIAENKVTVNGRIVKSKTSLKEGDEIRLELPSSAEPEILPQNIPLDILYEDGDVVVVNKPKGMVVHPAAGHYSDTLVNALLYHCSGSLSGINGVMRPGIVHRIDKDTTGSLIVCKNDRAHEAISSQLKDHSITRKYLAICLGVLKEDTYRIEGPIGRHPQDRKRMAINYRNGKPAVTHVKVLERMQGSTFIECRLETGRTHQIRVHMSSIGHPLLGDEIYGDTKNRYRLQGQTLHACLLGFNHPITGEYIETKAEIPLYFDELLKKLRIGGINK